MGDFSYLIYKNKTKIIIGATVAIIFCILLACILSSDKKGKKEDIADSGGNNVGDAPITIVPTDGAVKEITERQTVFKVKDGEEDAYEIVLDKVNTGTYLYKNGEITDIRCFTEKQDLDVPLLTLDDTIPDVTLESLNTPKIEGAYQIDKSTSSGVINHLLNTGYTEVRRVEAQDYFEIYLRNKKEAIKRIIVTNEMMFIADFKGEELPDVSSYWQEY